MNEKANILIIDDHQLFTESLQSKLIQSDKFNKIYTMNDADLPIEKLIILKIDLILLDININKQNGLELITFIKNQKSDTKILMVSSNTDLYSVQTSYTLGADGYVNKSTDYDNLLAAIENILLGKKFFVHYENLISIKHHNTVLSDLNKQFYKISKRELQIIKLLADGASNKDISEQLQISIRTVETHRKNILSKLNVNTVINLVREAKKLGYIE